MPRISYVRLGAGAHADLSFRGCPPQPDERNKNNTANATVNQISQDGSKHCQVLLLERADQVAEVDDLIYGF